jgi:O-antigen ligase/Flp pilus assembly protein TadD
MSAKNYLRILRGGLIISLFFVLFIFPSLLFPFITSKQLPFNILMEILFVFWLVFIWRYKSYRPKLNLIVYGLLAYFVVILVSCFTGVDFNLSFWGDIERMLGFFHIFHFLIFFFILITVFRTWLDWRLFFQTSILVAIIVSLIGLLGQNPHSTIGNTTYVSGYLIFNLFFAAILFFRTYSKWRYIYLIPVVIMLLEFKNMHTSGAIIGLATGIFVFLVLVGIFHKKRKIKYSFLSLAILSLLIFSFIFSQQEAVWFQNSFLKDLTPQKATFQTRLLSWQGAWQDFANHPILGTGFGNYAIIFDRYFNPKFFNYDRHEIYFDRAHNNLIDIASTTGLLGLISYLSIFIFTFYYIIKLWRRNETKINFGPSGHKNLEIVVIITLLVTYFVQNLAVFDSFVTYIPLMAILGFVYWLMKESSYSNSYSEQIETSVWLNHKREKAALIIFLVLAFIFTNQYNLKTWRMLEGVITGYGQIVSKKIVTGFDTFHNSLKDGPLDRDARSSLLSLISTNPIILSSLTEKRAQEEFDYLESLAKKNLAHNSQDNLFQLQLAQLYDLGARLFYEDEEKKDYYSNLSLKFANQAVISSPGRIPVYFSKAQALLLQNKGEEAIETLEYAVSLNPDYSDSYCHLGQIYSSKDREDEALEAFIKCIDGDAIDKLGGINSLINTASFLAEKKDYNRALIILERLVKIYDTDPEMWLNLAKLYLLTGDTEGKARLAANQAIVLDPSFSLQVEELFGN